MKRRDFDALVQRIETRYIGRHPALERATTAWVALGLGGILAWVGLLLLLGAGLFALGVTAEHGYSVLLLGAGAALIVYAISQAGLFLLVEHSSSDGRVLLPGEAPALRATLDELGRELQCRPFDEVRISFDFNASVREIPRLGLFGWPRTILEIGMPLLTALSPDELRAVLAHEFAHLSARHGRSGGRIYRLHRTWGQVFEQMQRPASGRTGRAIRWSTSKFIDWYWPRLNARTFVLSRAQEYQADAVAATLAGPANLASALWRMECLNPWLSERFWPDIHQEASRSPEPPTDVLDRLRAALEVPPSHDDSARWVERGLSRATGNDSTHPAFNERARALGVTAD
jgi:hypothetical protein